MENDHSCYDRYQEQCTQQKSEGHAKAGFTGIADITNGEFQAHYAPFDNDQQINSTICALVQSYRVAFIHT